MVKGLFAASVLWMPFSPEEGVFFCQVNECEIQSLVPLHFVFIFRVIDGFYEDLKGLGKFFELAF